MCARCRKDPAIDRSRWPSGDTRSRRCVARPWPRHSSNCASSASATVRALISNSPTRRRHRSPLSANGASRQAAIPLVAHHTDRRRVPPHLFRPKQPAGEPRTAAEPNWVCEYLPFVPNEMALRMLLNAENPKEGSLLARAPRRPRSGVLLIARATDDGTTAATNRKTKIPPAREFLAHTDFLHELSIRYPLPLGHPVGGMSIPSPRGPSALTAVSQHDGSAL